MRADARLTIVAAREWSRPKAATWRLTVPGRLVGRGAITSRVLEVTVSLVASAVIATMVAIGGSAVQVTSATPLPSGGAVPRFFLDPHYTPEGQEILRTATPEPDSMTWCRPLSGSTICIREKS